MEDGQTIAYKLLGILQHIAPNGEAQKICTRLLQQAQKDGATQLELDKTMAYALVDGYRYGNWPWLKL